VAIKSCECWFCTGLSGEHPLFADSPAAIADIGSTIDVGSGDSGATMFAIASNQTSAIAGAATQAAANTNTAGTSATAAVPSWVSTLTTASIKADMIAADANGTVTYSGLKSLFANIGSALGTGVLTATQFADLKTVAANLNNGMTTSGYLTSIANALVNGSAANAQWTGGTAAPIALGNLGVGSTATQLNELVGKWFLGTDLPNAKLLMSGSNPYTVSYSIESVPVFAASGPSMNDINQGYMGDCYFLASLAEVANQNSSIIQSMFTDNGNNTYGVRFFIDGAAQYVTVNNVMANGGTLFDRGPNMWAGLAEKAYAQFQATALTTGNGSSNYGNAWSTIANGGWPLNALEAITGATSLSEFRANGTSWTDYNFNARLGQTSSISGLSSASVLSTLVTDLSLGYDLVLCSWTNATDSAGRTTLVSSHAMSIYGYDPTTQMLEIRNPWGTSSSGQYWDTTFEVSLTTLAKAGDYISVANVPGGAAPTPQATLSVAATSATMLEGATGTTTPFTFTVSRTGNTAVAASAQWAVSSSAANVADFVGGVLPSGTVSFAAGQTTQVIAVNVAGDTTVESDEAFTLTLSAPSAGATLGTASASGTILNDDAQLSIAATSAVKAEGNSGANPFAFTVTRIGYTGVAQSANWAVSSSAANGADFTGGVLPSGIVSFAVGQTSQIVTVNVAGDTTVEADENFTVNLANPTGGATLGIASATGTILNDDAVASLSVVATSTAKFEGAAGAVTPFTFTVNRTGSTVGTASAQWAVSSSAANSADFSGGVLPSGTVSFAAGQTSQIVTVNVAGDTTVESDEAFTLTLSSPSAGIALATPSATGTILNDDTQLSIAATSAVKAEGNSGATPFTFTVTRIGYTGVAQSANWAVSSSTANTADFTGGVLPSGTVNFAAGQTSQIVTVNVAGDTTVESDENFAVTLTNPTGGATLGTASASGTIMNDDVAAGGLHINLLWDASVAAAPAAFKTAIQSAATMLQNAFSNNIVVNIAVGWGEIGGTTITQSGIAEGGPSGGIWVGYSGLKSGLIAHATSTDDATAIAALPGTINPNGNGNVAVWRSQEKALGMIAGNDAGLDGRIGFSTNFPSSTWVGAALHEITHAMGRTSGYSPYGIEDLMRYSAPGVHAFSGGTSQYFSIDNGTTRIANFSNSSDYGDWASDSLTVNDPYNAFISTGANSLTAADLRVMDAIGFTKTIPGATIPATIGLNAPAMAFAEPAALGDAGLGLLAGPVESIDLTGVHYTADVFAAQPSGVATVADTTVRGMGFMLSDTTQDLGLAGLDTFGRHTALAA